ncbi:MAG TPA: glycosyltransferase [Rhabdochlamydiaceae bacterium]|jgi:hypothetical protein
MQFENKFKKLHFYQKIYSKNKELTSKNEVKIPKIIHFIWLGPNRFPFESIENLKSWKRKHPDWTIKFWTDKHPPPIEGMQIQTVDATYLPHLFEEYNALTNVGEKSLLLRYEILYKEGGLYVDHDAKCHQAFDRFHHSYDFYAAVVPQSQNFTFTQNCLLGPHIFGSKKRHPVFAALFSCIKQQQSTQWNHLWLNFTEGITAGLKSDKENKNIIFPAFYFYANSMLSKNEIKNSKDRALRYASHYFNHYWFVDRIEGIKELISYKYKETRDKILKRTHTLNLFLHMNLCMLFANACLFFYQRYWKRRHECA